MSGTTTLDGAIAWHLSELAKLCPPGTRFTIVCRRTDVPDGVLVLGDDPDTKAALFAAVRAIGAKQKETAREIRARGNVMAGSGAPAFDPFDLNAGMATMGGELKQ